ncbi:hypothetical protein HYV89_05425 [Candidatus Woesearchaeota archaeon]|nr:hypothetical protein [Candidatus Woesearchaeota archaeon]
MRKEIILLIAILLVSSVFVFAAGSGGGGANANENQAVVTQEESAGNIEVGEDTSSNEITGAVVGTGSKTSKILVGVVIALAVLGLIFQFFGKKLRFKNKGIF